MTWPPWSTARYTYRQTPATLTEVSSTHQRPPTVCRAAGRVHHQRREVLDPPIQRDVIDFYPGLPKAFPVAIRQAERRYPRTASTITSAGNR